MEIPEKIQPSAELIGEILSYPDNELIFRVETEIEYLIRWAERDLKHAHAHEVHSDIHEINDRLFNLRQASISISKSYKSV